MSPLVSRLFRAAIFAGVLVGFSSSMLRANEPGGFTPRGTAEVTTGVEREGGRVFRFLDNGILRARISADGGVHSIKYLPPGAKGTPAAQGTEMVSQSGEGFRGHTAIYYYWYPDSNRSGEFAGVQRRGDFLDLACRHIYEPGVDKVAMDIEIHYVLGWGNRGLYVYLVAHHPAGYPEARVSFIQMIWPGPHTADAYLCENQYLDDSVKNLTLDGRPLPRNGLQPTLKDEMAAVEVPGYPKEIRRYTTGLFAGQLNGKYSYTFDYPTLGAWGLASDKRTLGLWVVAGNHDYQNNGPTAAEYAGGYTGVLLFEPLIAHYGNTGLTVPAGREWTKIYGPWMLYFNSLPNGARAWQDARAQAEVESRAWPYPWLAHPAYESAARRATVKGRLVIRDALRPGANAAGAWVGLAAPESPKENAPDNWQYQSDGYQYWVRADARGNFVIPHVQTRAPDGSAAVYQLYAFSAGRDAATGAVGEFSTGPVALTAGGTTDLGTLTWNVPHRGGALVWEIGIPNRSASEFRHGGEYARPGLWEQFAREFSNPLDYRVEDGNWASALNYCHSVDRVPDAPWKWRLHFTLPRVESGVYWLTIAYASAASTQVLRLNDDSRVFATFTPDNAVRGATTYLRQGIHAKYTVAHVPIPSNKLRVGENVLTLDHEMHGDHATAHFMYDYLSLEAPVRNSKAGR